MRIGNFQLLPEEDDFDAEVFSFLNHQEPLDFTSSAPGGLFRPVPIPAIAPSSLENYHFRPVQPVRKCTNRSESSKQRKSRRRKLKESREETINIKQEGETMAGGDCGEKLQDKHRFEIKETTETKETNEITVTKQSRLENYLPESVLCMMCQKDTTEFTFQRSSIDIEFPSVSSVTSFSSLDKQSSAMEVIKSSVDVPQEKKSLLTRLRRFARRAAKRFI